MQAQRAWAAQWHISHHIYCSEAGPGEATTGMMLLIQREFMAWYKVISHFSEIFGGRACSVELSSPHGLPLYSLCVHAERFDARMMASLATSRRARLGLPSCRLRSGGGGRQFLPDAWEPLARHSGRLHRRPAIGTRQLEPTTVGWDY